ncbi:conserved hypothetical protein [Sulfolobus islandicus L.S.2.15]|uniref:DUF5658 domain-containing protein n=1 Tax=Saccharolobus islandicus (strain L.S.2.15 / Lassen \|nr:hypothetical protein [Sulfolobus islandicus]ACP34311.1 conserved hypothetical protein [Sulfolobus islandicus L.S.2.15]AQQ16846.1 C102 [Sulfolobus spindle-shaped virus Lassen]
MYLNETLLDIILYYGFQFNDYWTTILGVNLGGREVNFVAKLFMKNRLTLAIYKFDLATVALLLAFMLNDVKMIQTFLLIVDVVECLVTLNNTLTIYRHKVRR